MLYDTTSAVFPAQEMAMDMARDITPLICEMDRARERTPALFALADQMAERELDSPELRKIRGEKVKTAIRKDIALKKELAQARPS